MKTSETKTGKTKTGKTKTGKTKTVWLLCVNDFHAEMGESEGFPGAAKLAAAVKNFVREHQPAAVLFGGDNYKGNPVCEYLKGRPVSRLMSALGVQASVLGNHDFDFGTENIRQWERIGGFPFLAANLQEKKTGDCPDFAQPAVALNLGDKKVLVIGLALPERLDTADRPREMEAYTLSDSGESIACVRRIQKEYEGKVNAVVALTHYGLRFHDGTGEPVGQELLELCAGAPQLDGVFAAHLHQFMALRINGVAVAEGGSNGRGFAWLKLSFDDGGRLAEVTPGYEDLRETQIIPDKEIAAIWEESQAEAMKELGRSIAYLDRPVMHRDKDTFEVDPQGTPLSRMATQQMQKATGARIALFYSGRIGYGFAAGELTLYEAYRTLFFGNGIVTMRLRGDVIRRNIEIGLRTLAGDGASPLAVGGMLVTADFSRPWGERLLSVQLDDGEPLRDEEWYFTAMDDFLADSSMGFDFTAGEDVIYTGIYLRQCMIDAITAEGRIQDGGHCTIIDVSQKRKDRGGTARDCLPQIES